MFERFTTQARETVHQAVEEASRRGDRRVSSEHLLIAVLHDPAIADQAGADAVTARAAADRLDRRSLAAVGVDADAFGRLEPAVGAKHLPFTSTAKSVLTRGLTAARAERAKRIETAHLWRALQECRSPDPAADLLAELRRAP